MFPVNSGELGTGSWHLVPDIGTSEDPSLLLKVLVHLHQLLQRATSHIGGLFNPCSRPVEAFIAQCLKLDASRQQHVHLLHEPERSRRSRRSSKEGDTKRLVIFPGGGWAVDPNETKAPINILFAWERSERRVLVLEPWCHTAFLKQTRVERLSKNKLRVLDELRSSTSE